jgi:anti-sigma factor RsiW
MNYPSGWSCERTLGTLEYYLLDRLQRVEALAVAEHLEACPGCAHSLMLYRVTVVGRRA